MDIACEPDLYCPGIDANGNFIDSVGPVSKYGMRCPCACRKDKVYDSHALFVSHTKTKAHQAWLSNININKSNLFVQCKKLEDTVAQQQRIIAEQANKIAQLEHELHTTTQCLAIQLKASVVPVANLLD
jgi:hypothetical protein